MGASTHDQRGRGPSRLISAAGIVDLGKNYVCSTMEALYVALLLYLPSTQPPAQSAL